MHLHVDTGFFIEQLRPFAVGDLACVRRLHVGFELFHVTSAASCSEVTDVNHAGRIGSRLYALPGRAQPR